MKKFLSLALSLIILFFTAYTPVVYSLDDYTVLTPLPNTTIGDNCTGTDCKTNFKTYIPGAFKLAVGIAAVMAFAMISYGGLLYMTTDSVFKAQEGKKRVWDAIQGLILVIGAYTILYTINPQILDFNLSIAKPQITNNEVAIALGTPGGGPTSLSNLTDEQVRAVLGPNNIQTQNNPCTGTRTTQCVTLAGLQPTTLDGLAGIRATCGSTCVIVLSGGTEGGHTAGGSHNNGTAVDILTDPNLDRTIRSLTEVQMRADLAAQGCKTYRGVVGGVNGTFLYEPAGKSCGGVTSSGTHWHASFP